MVISDKISTDGPWVTSMNWYHGESYLVKLWGLYLDWSELRIEWVVKKWCQWVYITFFGRLMLWKKRETQSETQVEELILKRKKNTVFIITEEKEVRVGRNAKKHVSLWHKFKGLFYEWPLLRELHIEVICWERMERGEGITFEKETEN